MAKTKFRKDCSFRVADTKKYSDRQTGEVTESTQWISTGNGNFRWIIKSAKK